MLHRFGGWRTENWAAPHLNREDSPFLEGGRRADRPTHRPTPASRRVVAQDEEAIPALHQPAHIGRRIAQVLLDAVVDRGEEELRR